MNLVIEIWPKWQLLAPPQFSPPTLSHFTHTPSHLTLTLTLHPSHLPSDVPGVPRTDELTAGQEGDQSLQ